MWRTGTCTWQDYKANEDILSEIKINPVAKKIQNYLNIYCMIGEWTVGITAAAGTTFNRDQNALLNTRILDQPIITNEN